MDMRIAFIQAVAQLRTKILIRRPKPSLRKGHDVVSGRHSLGDGNHFSATPDVAGSFLMRVGTDANAAPDIWLKRSADPAPAEDLSDAALSAAGWKQIVAQFDAGVTREHRH